VQGIAEGLMSSPGGAEVWTASQLSARLAALNGAAPEPRQSIVFRSIRHADCRLDEFYLVPGERRRLAPGALDFWLSRRGLAGSERLAVAVLVVRETVDEQGLVRQCTLEHRRGGVDGPLHGHPARVEMLGAADQVRLYEARLDGRLTEVPPSAEMATMRAGTPAHFAGAYDALRAKFGDSVQLIDVREPTLFEDIVGIAKVIHVRNDADREIGCAVIWHADIPIILEGEFPRLGSPPDLPPADAAAIDAAIAKHRLIRGELRLDEHGLAIVARRPGEAELLLLRADSDGVRLEQHEPNRDTAGPDQLRWMQFAESYEGLVVIDFWQDDKSTDLIVLTGDLGGDLWRHHIDLDGVETWRRLEKDAAVGPLHRERLFPGTLASERIDEREEMEPADGSLLARMQAFVHAEFADTLARIEARLNDELAQSHGLAVEAPFGTEVAAAFPSLAYDIEEAALCLELRRPTAAVFHCTQVLRHGIQSLLRQQGVADPFATIGQSWQRVWQSLSGTDHPAALEALKAVEARWRHTSLHPADKYTEEEAGLIFRAVGRFMQVLATA
jgi:hypothetical protein